MIFDAIQSCSFICAKSSQNLHGLVQRLVQKEKQVLQLQSELDRYKVQNPVEDKEAVRVISDFGSLALIIESRRRKQDVSGTERSGTL